MELFIKRLLDLLEKENINQRELAKRLGVQEATISRYINGDRKPAFSVLAKMADALNTTTDYLIGRTNNPAKESAPNSAIGKRLKILLKENNITMKEFGTMFQLDESTVSLYLSGERNPDDNTKIKICDKFNVTLDWLIGRTEHRNVVVKEVAPGIIIAQRADSTKEYTAEELIMARNFIEFMRKKNEPENK